MHRIRGLKEFVWKFVNTLDNHIAGTFFIIQNPKSKFSKSGLTRLVSLN